MKRYLNIGLTFIVFLIVGILLLIFSLATIIFTASVAVAVASLLVVLLTFVYGLLTNQSYDRVCDNSEILYRLNKIGRWSFVVSFGFFLVYGIYFLFIK
jgi:uncharacterized paraquat-inducible protein A